MLFIIFLSKSCVKYASRTILLNYTGYPEFPEYSRIHPITHEYTRILPNTPEYDIFLPEYAFFKNIKPKFMTF